MGSSCSSGQAHKDKDSVSTRSEESPSYQVTTKKPSQGSVGNHSTAGKHSGVILEASTVAATVQQNLRQNNGTSSHAAGGESCMERKPLATKVVRNIATSSISADSMSLSSPPGTSTQSPRGDWQQFPPPVQQLNENMHNLLMGRVASAKTGARYSKIVIYVCAADSQDCCCEKRVLHTVVYPELRALCRRRGYELHIVDLHWKTGLEKQQDHEFPELCLGELARQMSVSYVVPVLFLSNSLGTPLLPNTVETQDFEMALKSAEDKELLQKWYSLDSHAQPPCYRLQPISKHIPGFKENCLEEKERALTEWRTEIERTLAVMVEVFPQELRDTYLTTVVEQEVHNTVCMSQELARRCLWVYRVYTQTGQSDAQSSGQSPTAEAELKRRLDNLHRDLKNQLTEKHILRVPVAWNGGVVNPDLPEHAQYLSTITQQLTTQLTAIVENIIEDHNKMVLKPSYGIDSRLFEELTQQTSFCQKAAQCSINREDVLQQVKTYLSDAERSMLVIHGPRGCGKSTLLARAAQCCHSWLPDAALMLRFVNVTSNSTTTAQILASVANQCSVLSTGQHVWAPHNVSTYAQLLPHLLDAASLQRHQIIMIDGIDQIREYDSEGLEWLFTVLPENVKVIVSIADDSPMFQTHREQIADRRKLIQMPSLGKTEADAILMASVMQYNHSVNSRVQHCVRASVQDCTLPLYVKVLAWQTSWWSGCDHEMKPLGDVAKQVVQMLEELEAILDKEKVEHALALMTAAKTGLCDSEMLDLLAHDPAFHSKATYVLWAPACLFWARLNKHLAPFVQWTGMGGMCTLQWRDSTLRHAVRDRYLGDTTRQRAATQNLVEYFQGSWASEALPGMKGRLLTQPNKTEDSYNFRKLDELPYQVYQLNGSICDHFLLDHSWLFDKLCGSDVNQVLEDISLEENALKTKNQDLVLLRAILEECAMALLYDGRQFYSKLHKYLSSHKSRDSMFAQKLYDICSNPPITSLLPLTLQDGSGGTKGSDGLGNTDQSNVSIKLDVGENVGNIISKESDLEVHFDSVVSLGVDNFVATVSTEREEICVWSVRDGCKVRILKGVTQPFNLQPVDPYRCVVLCRRELRVINLDLGKFQVKLKGVMNQKMPYFGLHDSNHLVALSRNRMYVNLMNLESGDCVTTFKVGEDRFLNSLLVSGDGRVLVCGDETQKPFPLLVWNLSSRKLLYDLRIPHHDFVTTLSAITYEGHYVCCVAKEVDEPGPNFIVVYDLQSGTLFKKWKPGVDTVSLAISSHDACVVSGLEDARILVWDLVTGNCRCSLFGHTAPVNFLRLDLAGGALLSADSLGRDRSLRLWDLNKGCLLAVYTPEHPVTCCEVTNGGRFVVLAIRGRPNISTLELRGPGVSIADSSEIDAIYGKPENNGQTFSLCESDR